jgi:hypothetical protein
VELVIVDHGHVKKSAVTHDQDVARLEEISPCYRVSFFDDVWHTHLLCGSIALGDSGESPVSVW